jgi:hypothetical protein
MVCNDCMIVCHVWVPDPAKENGFMDLHLDFIHRRLGLAVYFTAVSISILHTVEWYDD